jgi:hypothetical protein
MRIIIDYVIIPPSCLPTLYPLSFMKQLISDIPFINNVILLLCLGVYVFYFGWGEGESGL